MDNLTAEEKAQLVASSEKRLTNSVYKANVALKDGVLSTKEIIIAKYYALLLSELMETSYTIKIDDFEAKLSVIIG